MRAFEIFAALLAGLALLVVLKLIGMAVKVAAIGALIGMLLGFFLARAFRARG